LRRPSRARAAGECVRKQLDTGLQQRTRPKCNGPSAWKYFDAVQRDIDNLKAAAGNAIAWAKLGALAEGPRIASQRLWARPA
jgi:hypothetical protein